MQEDGPGGGQPPIIIKKVVKGGGHHGGAWKVAYADFVTAMMALFMVLWLMNANQETQEAVSSYFRDPSGTGEMTGSDQGGTGSGLEVGRSELDGLAEQIQQAMKNAPDLQAMEQNVQISVTGSGLRIELLESDEGLFFESGSPAPSDYAREMLALIVAQLNRLDNRIALEGHTDSKPFRGARTYSNWELSVDRANSARRILLENGLAADRIVEVSGFADRQLRTPDEPEDPANRRISLIVLYNDPPEGNDVAGSTPAHLPPATNAAGEAH